MRRSEMKSYIAPSTEQAAQKKARRFGIRHCPM